MGVSDPQIEPLEVEISTKGLSRRGPILLLWTAAVVLFLVAFELGGLENMAVMRILAGSPKPWAERVDFIGGSWGFTMWSVMSQAALRILVLGATAGLFALAASGLKRRKRWSVWMGMAVGAICLTLNTVMIGWDLWFVWEMLRNESGSAFGKPEPVWRDVPLVLPAILILLEIVIIVLLRKLSKLRVDVLH